MVVDQQIAKDVLAENMVIGQWYEVKGLIRLFENNYFDFEPIDWEPLPSEPNRPRWHRIVTNSVRMSPGREDYPSNDSWIELRTRKKSRNYEYSMSIIDPVEQVILSTVTEDDGSGYIYGIVNEAFPNWVKIGKTIDFEKRLAAYQTYSPYQNYKELCKSRVSNRHIAEGVAHRRAADISQVEQSGEWFYLHDNDVLRIIQTIE